MKLHISKCPMCGSSRVIRETGEFVTHDGFRISSIEYVRCKSCGEQFYDQDASRAIDDALRAAGRLKKRPKVYQYAEPRTPMVVSEASAKKKYGKRKSKR
jgi:YgiT-type zinc finger domain-containing protein